MLPWHPRYTQLGRSWPICTFNADLNLLKWIERGYGCKRVLLLRSEILLCMWCSYNG